MRTAIFDLDGTLADTSKDLLAAGNACFIADGHSAPLNHEQHANIAFAGGRAMLLKGAEVLGITFSEDDIAARYPLLLQSYADNIDRHTKLYDGVTETLDALATDGYALGVCTNKPEGLAQTLLEKLNIRDRFGALIGADTLPLRKPHPEPLWETIDRVGGDRNRAALIGDTITDANTGKAADVPVILVTFGPDGEAVRDFDPAATISHFRDLPGVLAELLD